MSKKRKETGPVAALPDASANAPTDTQHQTKKSKTGSIDPVEETLKTIKKCLQSLPEHTDLSLADVLEWSRTRETAIPWPASCAPSAAFLATDAASEYTFDFSPPATVAVVGSFMLQTSLSSADTNVDLLVEQPDGRIFRFEHGAKDHINWKYWLRRAFYLAVCCDAIKRMVPEGSVVSYETLNGNPFKSVIVIRIPAVERVVRVIPSLPLSDAFAAKLFRLSPQRANVRPSWLAEWMGVAPETQNKEIPTPYHNYALMSEALYLSHLVHLHETLASSSTLVSAVKMVKAFLRNAGVSAATAINGFLASIWIADMVRTGAINPSIMDELQIFRLVLKSWADVFAPAAKDAESFVRRLSVPSVSADEASFDHGSLGLIAGPMNLLYQSNMTALAALGHTCIAYLAFLEAHPDRLDRVFLQRGVSRLVAHDVVVEVTRVSSGMLKGIPPAATLNCPDTVGSGYLEGRIALVLRKGLTNRIRGPLTVKVTPANGAFDIAIGCMVDPVHVGRLVDLGPMAEDKETAAKYRGFWGCKAELRQFPDSSIRECAVWESLAGRTHAIPAAIISWLLARHFGISAEQVCSNATKLEFSSLASHDAQRAFVSFSAIFDALGGELRSLSSMLPLAIVRCVGLSAAHSHTAAHVPAPVERLAEEDPSSNYPSTPTPVYDFLIQFERSSAWPDERQALQHARQAFLLQLHRLLRGRTGLQSLVSREYIDIYYRGLVFRGWMEVPREALRCRVEGLVAEAEQIEQRTFWRPRFAALLHQLSARNQAFAATARLLKQFAGAHLLPSHELPEEFLDAVTAAVFLDTDQHRSGASSTAAALLRGVPAGSAHSGFMRVLDYIATFPWAERPLVLDMTALDRDAALGEGDDEGDSVTVAEDSATTDWSLLPRRREAVTETIALFARKQHVLVANAIESQDADGSLVALIPALPWTVPSRGTLVRLRLLAKMALEYIETHPKESSLAGLFSVGEAIKHDYDILIKLDPLQIQASPTGPKAPPQHQILGLAKIMRNASQANPLLFSLLPGFHAASVFAAQLQEALAPLQATLSYNPHNPVIMAVRMRTSAATDAVMQMIRHIGGDLILDIKQTR